MKEEILQLRNEGKTYNEIKTILGCSKSIISYYCGERQKEKTIERTKKLRETIPLVQKVDNFKYNSKYRKNFVAGVRRFQKRDNNSSNSDGTNAKLEFTFNWKDVIEKFGIETFCYLSGEPINLYDNIYSLDHIIPVSKGGENSFDNLGITHEIVNRMKSDLSVDELFDWCKKILIFNGYEVTKKIQV